MTRIEDIWADIDVDVSKGGPLPEINVDVEPDWSWLPESVQTSAEVGTQPEAGT